MARNQVLVDVAEGANSNGWTELTNGDVSGAITFQIRGGGNAAEIRYEVDDTEPEATEHGQIFYEGEGPVRKLLSELVALSGALRVFARPAPGVSALKIYVDHA